jgi:hypothetical protein
MLELPAMLRVAALMGIVWPAIATADESITKRAEPALPRHTVYAEVLGKAGPYGLGYELGITHGLALGVAASYAVIRDQQITTVAPYVHGDILRGERHSLYTDVGIIFVRSHIPSPVPEWDGMTDSGAGGQATLGWEWRPWKMLVRTSMGVAVGEGGAWPFLGLAIGARL